MSKIRFLIMLVLSMGLCSISLGQSIGVSFAGDNGGGTGLQITAGQTAGVVPAMNWNDATGAAGALAALNDDSGAASGASVTWSSANTWGGSGATSDDAAMVNGWLDDGGNGAQIDIAGIPYGLYDVYVYGSSDAGNEGRGWTTNVNGTDYYSGGFFETLTGDGSFYDGSTYVDGAGAANDPSYFKISGVSGSVLTVLGSRDTGGPALPNGSTDYRAAVSGIQIVQVPEPMAALMILPAVCGILAFRRRK